MMNSTTYTLQQAFASSRYTDPRFEQVCQALVACEREFDVEILVGINKITHKKQDGEYIGRELPANAEVIRKAMAVFCESQVPNSKFNFWKFTFELGDPEENLSATQRVKVKPHPVMYTEE